MKLIVFTLFAFVFVVGVAYVARVWLPLAVGIRPVNDHSSNIASLYTGSTSPTVTPASDLSYIYIHSGNKTTLELKNSKGESLEQGSLQGPMKDPVTGADNGKGVMEIYYSKPEDGEYIVDVKNVNEDGVSILLYDRNGTEKSFELLKGQSTPSAKIKIKFNKEDLSLSTALRVE